MDANRAAILDALRTVIDPETGLDIVAMGLVYGVSIEPAGVSVLMTLSSRGCPLGQVLLDMAAQAVAGACPNRPTRVSLTFEPAWSPRMLLASSLQ